MNEFTDRPPEPDVEKMNFKKGSPVKAITIGVVVDIGGSLVLGIILVMIYSVLLASEGLSPEEIEYQLINLDPHFILGSISAAFGLMAGESHYSTLDSIFLCILTLMCALLGAWLHIVKKANQTDEI
jgi:hypothetical protein